MNTTLDQYTATRPALFGQQNHRITPTLIQRAADLRPAPTQEDIEDAPHIEQLIRTSLRQLAAR